MTSYLTKSDTGVRLECVCDLCGAKATFHGENQAYAFQARDDSPWLYSWHHQRGRFDFCSATCRDKAREAQGKAA